MHSENKQGEEQAQVHKAGLALNGLHLLTMASGQDPQGYEHGEKCASAVEEWGKPPLQRKKK